MDPPLAPQLPLEMLHGVGDVDLVARDARGGERLVEDLAGRPDERPASQILLVPRLLAEEERGRRRRPFAEHRLRRVLVEITRRACLSRLPQALDRRLVRFLHRFRHQLASSMS